MPITIDVLVDTNILLRTQFDKPVHMTNASRALAELRSQGKGLATTIQNLAEFWNVSTRPETANGHGLSREETLKRLEYFERSLSILSESGESYLHWKKLIVDHDVRGSKVHDTRLVSVMLAFVIRNILTFNTADFARFPKIETLHPDQVVSPQY
jgi:predicted nucleic acid-binding protein